MITRSPQRGDIHGWRQLLRDAYKKPEDLLKALNLQDSGLAASALARPRFPLRVPQPFVDRMQTGNADDPLLRQVLPLENENHSPAGFSADPVGDLHASSANGVIHKYHGRALLITTGACAIHCRYCFRREFPYGEQLASRQNWRVALNYLHRHSEVSELILSGGDPLSLGTDKLRELTAGLEVLPHIRTLRIHTRLPMVLPQRVTDNLLDWLDTLSLNRVVVLHANHANEYDTTVDAALQKLRQTGATLLNQAVLMRGINDTAAAQRALAERGFQAGVLPYYLHLLDRAHGTAHFEADVGQARQIMTSLRQHLPGYLVPRLVREQAGAAYKLPVM